MRALRDRWTLTSRLHDRSDEGHPEKRILDCSIGWQNYQDRYGDFYPAEPGYSESDGDGFHAQFTRIPRLIRLGEDGKKRVYPVPGNDQVWVQLFKPEELTLGVPTSKQATDTSTIWTWDKALYIFQLIVGASGVKFKLILKRPVGTDTLHIPFESQGLQRQGSQLLHDGEVVALLRRPSVWHLGMSELDEPIPVDVRFEPGVIVLEFDPTGMQYPIEIDPPLDLQVGADTDDADERPDLGNTFAEETNAVALLSNTTAGSRRWLGLRWTGSFPSQGDTINVGSYIEIYQPSSVYNDALGDLYCEDGASPATFVGGTGNFNISGRSLTTNYVTWSEDDIPDGDFAPSPEMGGPNSPLQDVFDSYSPTALVVIGKPHTDTNKGLWVRTYYHTPSQAAKLHIEYTTGAAVTGGYYYRLYGSGRHRP